MAILPVWVLFQHGKGIEQVMIDATDHGLACLFEALGGEAVEFQTLPTEGYPPLFSDVLSLEKLRIMPTELPLCVQVLEDTLVISGSKEARLLLATNVAFLRQQPGGGSIHPHLHFDYVPEFTPELHPDTESFVITKFEEQWR